MPSSPSTSSRSFSLPRPATSSYSSHSYSPLPNLPRLPREVKRSLIRPWLASPTTSHFSQNAPDQRLSTQLRSRSRITNLALYILLAWLAISTLINVRSWAEDKGVRWEKEGEGSSMGGGERTAGDASLEGLPRSITETLAPLTPELEEVDHLIVVAGHAIYTGTDPALVEQDDQWILEPIQKGGPTVKALIAHIEAGAKLVIQDPKSLLVYSGGQTRPSALSTEGESYLRLALASYLPSADPHSTHFPRATTEPFALDSYQNLLFSIGRFKEYVGRYPSRITVVGFGVKEARFRELHRATIGFPPEQFDYVGIDQEGDLEAFRKGEYEFGFKPYSLDPTGCKGTLVAKRKGRNVGRRWASYLVSSPELRGLGEWCPSAEEVEAGNTHWPARLPWTP